MPDPTERKSDLEWINAMALALSNEARSEALRALVRLLIDKYILDANRHPAYEEREEAVTEEINERVSGCYSTAFAHELLGMAANNDPDFDQAVFPDGRADVILIADSEILSHGEDVLTKYVDYVETHPEYGAIHPSDYYVSASQDEETQWERYVDDFSTMLREWRDSFISNLIEDCTPKGTTQEILNASSADES